MYDFLVPISMNSQSKQIAGRVGNRDNSSRETEAGKGEGEGMHRKLTYFSIPCSGLDT